MSLTCIISFWFYPKFSTYREKGAYSRTTTPPPLPHTHIHTRSAPTLVGGPSTALVSVTNNGGTRYIYKCREKIGGKRIPVVRKMVSNHSDLKPVVSLIHALKTKERVQNYALFWHLLNDDELPSSKEQLYQSCYPYSICCLRTYTTYVAFLLEGNIKSNVSFNDYLYRSPKVFSLTIKYKFLFAE